jgi:hypothetical protein
MFFPRHVNMVQQMKKYVEISNVSLLSLYKQIYKSALLSQKNLRRVGKNGRKFVLKLVYAKKIEHSSENKILFIVYL